VALDRIEIKGFKSIREMDLELGPLNVFIGANGAGKTNFISAFQFLNQIAKGRLQFSVAKWGGANALLHFGQKVTDEISFKLHFGSSSYQATLIPVVNDALIFSGEQCWSTSGHYHLAHPEEARTESKLAVKDRPHPRAPYFSRRLNDWQIYHFHDTSESAKVKQTGDIGDNAALRPDASNLAAFLYLLRETQQEHYARIVKTIRLAAPFFDDFELRPSPLNPEKIRLEWREKNSDDYFNAHTLSDGTLRFICLSTLLLYPNLHRIILIDEPELGLHPYAINLLASMLRSAATKRRIIVSTQSVTLVNQFSPEDIIVVDREGGESKFKRLEAQEILSWLEEYSLGDLWEKNILGGRP
jgi:predicted ATPase